MKTKIHTKDAPEAIGPYSQAIRVGNTVYCSGQIPFDPKTMELINGDISLQTQRIFQNLRAVCKAAGGDLNAIVKLTIYLINLSDFAKVNEVMVAAFPEPYPARTTIQVAALPKGAEIEIDAVMVLE